MPLADLLPELLELEGKDLTPRATEVLLRLFTALFDRTEHQVSREEMQAVHGELRELRLALQQLTQVQLRTDQRLEAVAQAQEQLAEAQARTEEQVRELVQAQARTEEQVRELVQAQARTEAQIRELAQAQARTEEQVRELVQAQARTDQRTEALARAQERLAESQTRIEQRVDGLTQALERLAEAQARTEEQVQKLTQAQERLAEAQARTEQRVDGLTQALQRLAEAQARTEQRVDGLAQAYERLAEAQARTEERLGKLAEEFSTFRKEVRAEFRQVHKAIGGLSHVVGYTLENLACRTLPGLLKERFGYQVVEPFDRVWLQVKGKAVQVNLWALLRTPEGELVRVVGESKTQLGCKHLDELQRLMRRTQKSWGTPKALGVLVTHMPDPDVREEATARGLLVFTSRELEAAT